MFVNSLVRFSVRSPVPLEIELVAVAVAVFSWCTQPQPLTQRDLGLIKHLYHPAIGCTGVTRGVHSDFRAEPPGSMPSTLPSPRVLRRTFLSKPARSLCDLLEALVENRQRLESLLRILVQGPCLVVYVRSCFL